LSSIHDVTVARLALKEKQYIHEKIKAKRMKEEDDINL